jgi:hypothetical protein
MEGGIYRWSCSAAGNSSILFGVSSNISLQDENCRQNPHVHGWTTDAQRIMAGRQQQGLFSSTGQLTVVLELHCDINSKTAALKATRDDGGITDTIAGIQLPVFPFFNIYQDGDSITVKVS